PISKTRPDASGRRVACRSEIRIPLLLLPTKKHKTPGRRYGDGIQGNPLGMPGRDVSIGPSSA
ncbi:TPA: hypothetical protein DEP86_03805, partial [Candidatus Uhrbacteria bacterium]|nr:hypothetical protein [Candidatus Uhrbacteria bacterium]